MKTEVFDKIYRGVSATVWKNVLFSFFPLQTERFMSHLKVQNVPKAKIHKGSKKKKNQMLIHHFVPASIPGNAAWLDRFCRYPPAGECERVSIRNTRSLGEEIESGFLQGSFCIFLVWLL